MAQIGIKLADGSFYSILEDDVFLQERRVVLSPAHADQDAFFVEVQRRDSGNILLIGRLMLSELTQERAEAELCFYLEPSGNLDITLSELPSGQRESLGVNINELEANQAAVFDTNDYVATAAEAPIEIDDINLPQFDDFESDTTTSLSDTEETATLAPDDHGQDVDELQWSTEEAEATTASVESSPEVVLSEDEHLELPPSSFEAELEQSPDVDGDFARLHLEEEYLIGDADEEPQSYTKPRRFQPLVLTALLVITVSVALLGAWWVYLKL